MMEPNSIFIVGRESSDRYGAGAPRRTPPEVIAQAADAPVPVETLPQRQQRIDVNRGLPRILRHDRRRAFVLPSERRQLCRPSWAVVPATGSTAYATIRSICGRIFLRLL
jgi:hypothetical protein